MKYIKTFSINESFDIKKTINYIKDIFLEVEDMGYHARVILSERRNYLRKNSELGSYFYIEIERGSHAVVKVSDVFCSIQHAISYLSNDFNHSISVNPLWMGDSMMDVKRFHHLDKSAIYDIEDDINNTYGKIIIYFYEIHKDI